jgi:hypothetical protein
LQQLPHFVTSFRNLDFNSAELQMMELSNYSTS